jgi:hypothetical protein
MLRQNSSPRVKPVLSESCSESGRIAALYLVLRMKAGICLRKVLSIGFLTHFSRLV